MAGSSPGHRHKSRYGVSDHNLQTIFPCSTVRTDILKPCSFHNIWKIRRIQILFENTQLLLPFHRIGYHRRSILPWQIVGKIVR